MNNFSISFGSECEVMICPGTDSDDYIKIIGPNAMTIAKRIVKEMNKSSELKIKEETPMY